MVSQGSNVGSDGVAVDHDGNRLEDFAGLDGRLGPIPVVDTVMMELLGSNPAFQGDVNQAESSPRFSQLQNLYTNVGSGVAPLMGHHTRDDSSSSDRTLSPSDAIAAVNVADNSSIFRAALQINSNEREAAINAQKKVLELQTFIMSKGYTLDDVNKSLVTPVVGNRDEFGLPILGNASKRDIVSPVNEVGGSSGLKNMTLHTTCLTEVPIAVQPNFKRKSPLLDGSAQNLGVTDVTNVQSSPKNVSTVGSGGKSWSDILKKPGPSNLQLEYFPLADGTTMVSPPDDVLKEGLEKFKLCMVGNFTKGTLSFKAVNDIAHGLWDDIGLVSVSHKDSRTFIFKFDSEQSLNFALSKGTWYFSKRPMVVHAWGTNVNSVSSVPLWIKLHNVPECFWSTKGLSFLASAIEKPICTDPLTAKLDMLPFAKICVEYKNGGPLPDDISAVMLDAYGKKDVAIIQVEYPVRPLSCGACKSVGHTLASCPSSKRIWVEKPSIVEPIIGKTCVEIPPMPPAEIQSQPAEEVEAPWSIVQRKSKATLNDTSGGSKSLPTEFSPSPVLGFKNLRQVDEIEKKKMGAPLAKTSRKKMKQARNANPSPSPNK